MKTKVNVNVGNYESPKTKKMPVQLEGGICASINPDNPKDGGIESHEVNTDFGYSIDSQQQWEETK